MTHTSPAYRLVIQPSKRWAALGLRDLWEYRDLLYFMVWRDLKARYRQTALGWLWIVLQPLVSMVLYTVVFGVVARLPSEGLPYSVFTYTALLPWTFFAGAVTNSANSLLDSKALISKVYFPRLIVPLSRVLSGLVDFAISLVILGGMLAAYGIRPSAGILLLPVFLLLASLAGLGVGLWFAGVIVRFRDFSQVAGYLVRGWMYATPVVYSIEIVPEQWRALYRLNPMTGVVEGFRWALLGAAQQPDWRMLALSAALVAALCVGGLFYFRAEERSIVDVA